MPVKDVKIYTGATEGWVSIGDLSKAKLPISSTDGTVIVDGDASVFSVSTGGKERVVVDSIGNVTINEKLRGDGNYTPLIELSAGHAVNVTKSRYYNYYAVDGSTTHREIIYNADSEAACSFLVYGKTYASGLPVGIPVGEQPSHFKSSHDLVHEVKRMLWCSSSTNAEPDVVIDCTTDSNDPVLRVVPKGHIEASRIQTDTITTKDAANPSGGVTGDATINLGSHITVNANAGGTDEELVAVFSSYYSQSQRGLQIKNGINANRANAHVVLDAKSDGDLGLITIQTDGNDALTIGKTTNGEPVDIAAFAGYVPQTDQSLVTKGWVTANGASGNLPISSEDGKTKLYAPSSGSFAIDLNDKQRMFASHLVGIKQDPISEVSLQIYGSKDAGGNTQSNQIRWIKSDSADASLYTGVISWAEASGVLTILGQSNYGAAFTFDTVNRNFIVNGGEIRTDSPITTKDSANLDASIQFYGKNYLLRSRDGLGYAVIKGAEYDPAFNGLRYLGETGAFAISNYVPDTDAVLNISNRNINRASTIDFSKGPVGTNKDESKRWASISNPDRYKGLEYRVYSSSAPETWTNAPPHVFYATAPSDATGAEYEILRMLWNRFTVSTGGEERVVVDATVTSLKKGNYLALEDATGLRCGSVQGSAGRFFVQALSNTDFYLRATGVDYAIVKPSEQSKGLQAPRGITSPFIRGLADNDSQITLGADLRVFANASSEEVFTVMHTGRVGINTNFPLGELHVGGEEASIILQKEGKSAWFQQALNDDLVFGTLADYGTVPPTVNSFLQIAGNGDVIINRQVRTPTISGLSNTDAAITLGSQATLKAGDGSEYVPTDDNSLVTRKFVEGLVGSGGNVNPDTVPGTGATAQWEEQSVEVSNIEPNQQAYSALYSYSGIFTDGLHWTSDGYQWNTSDPTSRIGYLSQTIDLDNNIVVKGNGNEYVTAQAISSDMKSWRSISGIGYNPFYLDGNFYTENGGQILDRTNARWVTSSAFGGSLPNDRNSLSVASQESGLYVLAVYQDGTVHWSTGLSGPSAWQQDARISGAKCCKFIERMGKWLVIGESEFWISDNANLGSVNWTNGTLPTSANWDRVVDDGGTISITSTAEKFNLVLYCTEENGPALQGDWQTTVNYNNRGYKGFTGTNGRTIGSMQSEVSGDVRSYYYGVSGDIRIDAKMDTRHVTLTNPVSISFARAIEAQTQEDANAVFTEEIQRRSPVLTLTQAEYDAIPADEIEDSTLYLITS